MRFLVAEIRDSGPVRREETVEAVDLLGPAPESVQYRSPVNAKVQAKMTHEGEIIFSGKVETAFTVQCGRCLEMFERPIKLNFEQVITPADLEVDITPEIRETVFLDLPVNAVCRDNCRGICASCGTNLNKSTCGCASTQTDSRWDALKRLRIK